MSCTVASSSEEGMESPFTRGSMAGVNGKDVIEQWSGGLQQEEGMIGAHTSCGSLESKGRISLSGESRV